MKAILLCLMLGLAACSSSRRLPMPDGPVWQLNTDRWTATQAELHAARGAFR